MFTRNQTAVSIAAAATLGAALVAAPTVFADSPTGPPAAAKRDAKPVLIDVVSPRAGDNAGVKGAGWIVDLDLEFQGSSLSQTGFTASQLTGPATHNNAAPFPGAFSPGVDDRLPGLVVLSSTTTSTVPGFSGPGTNLANLFNVTGVTDRSRKATQISDTWIVGAPIAGTSTTILTVAVVDDLNHDGIYNDAPAVVPDSNADGRISKADLEALGLASDVELVKFRINAK
jgi:hypothetical protein